MHSFFTKIICFFFLSFASVCAFSQTKFTVSVSPQQAGKDEYITLKYTVANGSNIQQVTPPSFNDFSVVSGPNQETEMNSVNGVIRQYISLSFVLLPKKTGTFSLGPATAVIDGKTYKTEAIDIKVSGKRSAGTQPPNNPSSIFQLPLSAFDPFNQPQADAPFDDYILQKGESVPEKVSRNMQLKLQTDKTSCYVGEPLVATYKMYTRLRSESSLSKNPSFSGFSVVDMMMQNDPVTATHETLNGRDYNVYVIRKAQLYPLLAGPVQLETATLDNKISFLKNTFGSGEVFTQNVTLSSKPLTITVKPLPEAGKPADFKGAVGNFKTEATLEKNNFSTDETGKLLLTISGRGNLQMLTLPDIKWPAGLDAFDAKLTDNTDNTTVPISGSKTFEIPFAVQKPGNYTTPEISFSFFNPATASYNTVHAPGITFSVVKGSGRPINSSMTGEKAKPLSFINSLGNQRSLIIIFIAALMITGIILGMVREKKIIPETKPQAVNTIEAYSPTPISAQQDPLSKTEDCLQKEGCKEFYAVLNDEMKHFLAHRFNIPVATMTCKGLTAAMDRAGIDNTLSLQTHELLQDIHQQLYTPFEQNDELKKMYARAQTIIQLLGRQYV